jgi:hypothetical protein
MEIVIAAAVLAAGLVVAALLLVKRAPGPDSYTQLRAHETGRNHV